MCDHFRVAKHLNSLPNRNFMMVRMIHKGICINVSMSINRENRGPFLEVPKLFGHILGDIILFVSSKRRHLEAQNLAVILVFIPFTTYKMTSLQNKQVTVYEWLVEPEKFA